MAEGTIGGTPIADLPASSFAYCEPGDGAVSVRCHFPIRDASGKADAPHVRNAMARMEQSPFADKARAKIMAAAKELGIGENMKAGELKAEPMDTAKLERWLSGKMPRRILVAPFYGPVKASVFGYPEDGHGRDIEGDYFHPDTDFYGPYPALKASRTRAVDWHHAAFSGNTDPVGDTMKAAIIGNLVLDDVTEDDGLWADFWANAGEKRRKLVADLELRGAHLYGSTQAVRGASRKADYGRIDVWPIQYHTISTSPVNTYAVVPPLKAILTAPSLDEIPAEALKALLVGLDAPTADLLLTSIDATADPVASSGDVAAKAGRVLSRQTLADLERVLALAEQELPALIRELIDRSRPQENPHA